MLEVYIHTTNPTCFGLIPSPSNIYPHLGVRKVPFCKFHLLDILLLYAVHVFAKGKSDQISSEGMIFEAF
jgi:hypothetical protein